MKLSDKPKLFTPLFAVFESTKCFKKIEGKDELDSLSIFEIIDSERRGYLNLWRVPFQRTR